VCVCARYPSIYFDGLRKTRGNLSQDRHPPADNSFPVKNEGSDKYTPCRKCFSVELQKLTNLCLSCVMYPLYRQSSLLLQTL